MEEEVAKELHTIALNLEQIGVLLQRNVNNFWDTQWFAALIGAVGTLSVILLKEVLEKRSHRMSEIYDSLMEDKRVLTPDSLVDMATSTSYSTPDKPTGEKTVIEFRSYCKYWRYPLSMIRYLLGKYEEVLWKLPNLPNGEREEVKNSDEYAKAEKLFGRISELIEKKTGENEWTRR